MLEQQHDLCTPCYSKMLMLWIIEETFSFAFEILAAEELLFLLLDVTVFEAGKCLLARNF